jgi:hypothetical protein
MIHINIFFTFLSLKPLASQLINIAALIIIIICPSCCSVSLYIPLSASSLPLFAFNTLVLILIHAL